MSVFRPLNSDESNLFTIRCVISFTSAPGASIIAGGSKVTVGATNLLVTPTSNNLPDYFGIYYGSNIFYVTYGKEFTSTPSINIMPRLLNVSKLATTPHAVGDAPTPIYFWNNVLNYGKTWANTPVSNSNYNFAFTFKEASDGSAITPSNTSTLNGFDLVITGPVKLGVTTGNSNKGWSVGSGNDATSAYSYMDIGVGNGNPICAMDVTGGFRRGLLSYTHEAIDGVVQTGTSQPTTANGITIPLTNCGKIITLDSTNGAIRLNLPTPAKGLAFTFVLIADAANAITITSTTDGTTASNISLGKLVNADAISHVTTAVDLLTFVASTAVKGDRAECFCDGTNWFYNAVGSVSGAITLV